jgi:methyl-accepting chemotaxis protein
MGSRAGLGKTGENVLVGPDFKMRSDSHRDKKYHTVVNSFRSGEKGLFKNEATIQAIQNKKDGIALVRDYLNNPTLIAYSPVKISDSITWAINTKIDISEAYAPKIMGEKNDFLSQYKNQHGFNDLFLINPDGDIFYSVKKGSDYQTNLISGKYSSSSLGQLFRRVVKKRKLGVIDFAPYAPNDGNPASFIAMPVISQGKIEMIVALELPLKPINTIMQQRTGMGERRW